MSNNANTMTSAIDQQAIDRLVREVIRRLMEPAKSDGRQTSPPNLVAQHNRTQNTSSPETGTLNEPIVTAAMIERMPATQKELLVPSGAIITPAARDEAHRRTITIKHNLSTAPHEAIQTQNDPQAIIYDRVHPERAESIAAQLNRRGVAMPSASVMLSETPGQDVYEQCSRHGRRAVMISTLADVDRFSAELDPTFWVLDMTKLNFIAATNVVARISQVGGQRS